MCFIVNNLKCLSLRVKTTKILIGIDLKKTTMKSLEYSPPPSRICQVIIIDNVHFVNKNPRGVLLYICLIGIGLK